MKHAYSDGLYNQRIALFGPLPPPLGGVSVHVERVMHKLKNQHNDVFVFNSVSEWRYRFFIMYAFQFIFFLVRTRPHILIYHTTYLSNAIIELRLLLFLKHVLGYTLYLIEHDFRFIGTISLHIKRHYQQIVSCIDKHIFIGSQTAARFIQHNIYATVHTIESAFLPPHTHTDEQYTYPQSLYAFIHTHDHIIAANAFQLSAIDGKELYGFDQLVIAFVRYAQDNKKVGLLLLLAQKGDKQLYDSLCFTIAQYGMQEQVYILVGNYLLWPLFKYIDLFVRPTISDGASVSVEEAIHFGIKTIASDVCWRPATCVLYKSGDSHALYHALKEMI